MDLGQGRGGVAKRESPAHGFFPFCEILKYSIHIRIAPPGPMTSLGLCIIEWVINKYLVSESFIISWSVCPVINFQTFHGIWSLKEVSQNILRMFITPERNLPAEAPMTWLGKPANRISQPCPPISRLYHFIFQS